MTTHDAPPRAFRSDGPGTSAAQWGSRVEWADVPEVDLLGVDRPGRVVVAAAHPDDESLGAGGTIAALLRAGVPVSLVLATAGEHSHPRSPTMRPDELARRRQGEAEQAWAALGGDAGDLTFLGLSDGGLDAREDELAERLVDVLQDARDTLLLSTWRFDGHPDHDALGRAAARAAHRTGARLWQYPIWFWHRANPDEAPWPRLVQAALMPDDRAAKDRAIASHASQVAPLSAAPGDETLLGPGLLAHFAGAREIFVVEPTYDDALDGLHGEYDDPWGTRTRWYEERKRDLLLAMLPRRRFGRGLDLGCSTGTLTRALAPRCDELVALDASPRAVAVAQRHLVDLAAVEVRQANVPTDWPDGRFDLVVVSEAGYFLSPVALDGLIARIGASLSPGGCLVLAHWRHRIAGWPLTGPRVHARFEAAPSIGPVVAAYEDRDVAMVVHAATDVLPDPFHTDG